MKFGFRFAFLLCPFALLACEVQTPGGVIPDDYLDQAKAVTGDYRGSMDSAGSGTLSVRLKGKKLVASYSKSLLSQCSAKIGELQNIDAGNGSVDQATFAMTGGDCVSGSHVFLKPVNANSIRVQILKNTYTTRDCPSEREISKCEDEMSRRDDNSCDQGSTFDKEDCRRDRDRRFNSCSECSDVSHDEWIYGLFQKR